MPKTVSYCPVAWGLYALGDTFPRIVWRALFWVHVRTCKECKRARPVQ